MLNGRKTANSSRNSEGVMLQWQEGHCPLFSDKQIEVFGRANGFSDGKLDNKQCGAFIERVVFFL